jgi:hypothetical protein
MEDRDVAYQLLGILQHYAPTGAEQQLVANLYNEIKAEGSDRKLVIELSGMLIDGLAEHNWPWSS